MNKDGGAGFINGRKEYIDSVTSLPVLELQKYTDVKFADDYYFNVKKIGDSILYIKCRGNMGSSDMQKYYRLLEDFIMISGAVVPVVEIRDFSELTGRTPNSQRLFQKEYTLSHQQLFKGFIFCRIPLWLKVLVTTGRKIYKPVSAVLIADGYSAALMSAVNLLEKGRIPGGTLNPDDLFFDPHWEYQNSKTGFRIKSGIVAGRLLFTEISGDISLDDIRKAGEILDDICITGTFSGRSPVVAVDYTGVKKSSLAVRKYYTQILDSMNFKYNCRPEKIIICGADWIEKSSIRIMASLVNYKLLFVKKIDEAFALMNTSPGNIGGKKQEIIVTQEDIDRIYKKLARLLWESKIPETSEDPEPSSSPLKELEDIILIMKKDIIDLRKSDRLKTEELQNIFEAIPMGIVILEEKSHRILFVNNDASGIVRFSEKELVGKTCHETFCPVKAGQCIADKFSDNLNHIETAMRCSDGEIITVLKSVRPILYKDKSCLLEAFIDVSDKKRMEKEREDYLNELEQGKIMLTSMMEDAETARAETLAVNQRLTEIQTAVDVSKDAIEIYNSDMQCFYINRTFTALFGYKMEEYRKKSSTVIYSHPENFRHMVEDVKKQGTCDLEVGMVSKEGKEFPVHIRAAAVRNRDGKMIGLICTHSDISERVSREYRTTQLNKLQSQLLKPGMLENKLQRITDTISSVIDSELVHIWLKGKGKNKLGLISFSGRSITDNRVINQVYYEAGELYDKIPPDKDRIIINSIPDSMSFGRYRWIQEF